MLLALRALLRILIREPKDFNMTDYATYPSLKAKSIYITGGATGIGAVMVEEFTRQGALVTFIDIADEAAITLCDRIESKFGRRPDFESLDVTHIEKLQESIRRCASVQRGLDILINNVANDQRHSPLDINHKAWRECLAVNLDATFFACQAAIPLMKARNKGNIINLSSINVLIGPIQMPGYVAAKSALNGLSKSLANQYGENGIRVNTVMPGWVATERQIDLWLTPEADDEWQKTVALRGHIKPIQIANMVLFLASDDSEMITGQQFVIDAGRT